MNNQIMDALKNLGVPVSFQTYSGTDKTYITFQSYLQQNESFADNEATSDSFYYQVNVWSTNDYTSLVDNVLNALKNAGFRRTYITELYEVDTKIYHKVIRVTKTQEII